MEDSVILGKLRRSVRSQKKRGEPKITFALFLSF